MLALNCTDVLTEITTKILGKRAESTAFEFFFAFHSITHESVLFELMILTAVMTVRLAVTCNVMACASEFPLLAKAPKETSAFILRLEEYFPVVIQPG